MAARDTHGVVVVRVSSMVIHRPNYGGGHGAGTLATEETDPDWELFPNQVCAEEAGYKPCGICFWVE